MCHLFYCSRWTPNFIVSKCIQFRYICVCSGLVCVLHRFREKLSWDSFRRTPLWTKKKNNLFFLTFSVFFFSSSLHFFCRENIAVFFLLSSMLYCCSWWLYLCVAFSHNNKHLVYTKGTAGSQCCVMNGIVRSSNHNHSL